jgi:hypothetical protein
MMNYVTHRAIFEGMNAHLWKETSGRLLWMTQPAWPSSAWQILSSDYDTHGSFYGTMKAAEPVHVQLNLPDYGVVLVNNTVNPLSGLSVKARVVSLDNHVIAEKEAKIDAAAIAVTPLFTLDLPDVAFVKLEARDASGRLVSENFYWPSREPRALQRLNELPKTRVNASATSTRNGAETRVHVTLKNAATAAALNTKITLFNADGKQVLPAYLTDNYISLLPGESRDVDVSFPTSAVHGAITLTLRGWNVESRSVRVSTGGR